MPFGIHTDNFSPTAVQITNHVPHVFVRDRYFHVHDRFENHRLGLLNGAFETEGPGDLERHVRRVHIVIGTVIEPDAYIDHRIPGDNTPGHRFLDPLLDRRDIVSWNGATNNLINKFKPLALGERFYLNPGIAVLAPSAGLFFQSSLGTGADPNGFFVRHLGGFENDFRAVFALQLFDDDLDVLLPHARKDEVPRLLVAVDLDRRVFFHDSVQALRHLLFIRFAFRFESKRNNRRKMHRTCILDRRLLVTQCIASRDLFQLRRGHDITGGSFFNDVLFLTL